MILSMALKLLDGRYHRCDQKQNKTKITRQIFCSYSPGFYDDLNVKQTLQEQKFILFFKRVEKKLHHAREYLKYWKEEKKNKLMTSFLMSKYNLIKVKKKKKKKLNEYILCILTRPSSIFLESLQKKYTY